MISETAYWIKSYWRIVGLLSIISYMVVIILIWAIANAQGYTYFSGGEPTRLIKYSEWALGLVGILTAIYYLKLELKEVGGNVEH